MATKIVIGLLLAVALTEGQQVVNGKIKITVVTTSGCGDTVNFITQQLNQAYGLYKEYLNLEFVPWGRTRRNQDGSLTCQFGTNDCWANRLQRCTLDLLRQNQTAQMEYMNCEFTSPFPSYIQQSTACASVVSEADLLFCMYSSVGDDLEEVAEALAQQPMAQINFVPSIVFNDQINLPLHNQARIGLSDMICSALAADPSTGITNC